MNRILFPFIGIVLFLSSISAQKMHTEAQLTEIMAKSKIVYQVENLEKSLQTPDRKGILNSNDYCRIKKGELFQVFKYDLNKNALAFYEKGDLELKNKNFQAAKVNFFKAYEIDSSSSKIMTGIGRALLGENETEQALQWLIKAVNYNYIDFDAHRYLAGLYLLKKDFNNAVEQITIAHLLDRNNADIIKELKEIYLQKNINYFEWTFNPQCIIEKAGGNKIRIISDENWLGYALFQAVWLFEPGYAESMGGKGKRLSFIREKELLQGLLSKQDMNNLNLFPEFKAFDNALNYKTVNEFIFYEMKLPDDPSLIFLLTENFINAMKDYIIYVRSKM